MGGAAARTFSLPSCLGGTSSQQRCRSRPSAHKGGGLASRLCSSGVGRVALPVKRLPPAPPRRELCPQPEEASHLRAVLQPAFWEAAGQLVQECAPPTTKSRRPPPAALLPLWDDGAGADDGGADGGGRLQRLPPVPIAAVAMTPSGTSCFSFGAGVLSPRESDFGLADWQLACAGPPSPIAMTSLGEDEDFGDGCDSEFGLATWQLQALHRQSAGTAPARPTALPPLSSGAEQWRKRAARMTEAACAIGARGSDWALLWHAFGAWREGSFRRAPLRSALPPAPLPLPAPTPAAETAAEARRRAPSCPSSLPPPPLAAVRCLPPSTAQAAHPSAVVVAEAWRVKAEKMAEAAARAGARGAAWALQWDIFRSWQALVRIEHPS